MTRTYLNGSGRPVCRKRAAEVAEALPREEGKAARDFSPRLKDPL